MGTAGEEVDFVGQLRCQDRLGEHLGDRVPGGGRRLVAGGLGTPPPPPVGRLNLVKVGHIQLYLVKVTLGRD